MVEDWAERSCEANDRCLQDLFRTVLATSAQLPPEQRTARHVEHALRGVGLGRRHAHGLDRPLRRRTTSAGHKNL